MQVLNANLGLQFQDSARIRTPKSQMLLESDHHHAGRAKLLPISTLSSTGHHGIFFHWVSRIHYAELAHPKHYLLSPAREVQLSLHTRNHSVPEQPMLEQHSIGWVLLDWWIPNQGDSATAATGTAGTAVDTN